MEEIKLQKEEETNLEISQTSKTYLKEISGWTQFFSILGFIFVGLLFLITIVLAIVIPFVANSGMNQDIFPFVIIIVVYFALAIIYLFPVLYLYRFTTNLKSALFNNNNDHIVIAFKNLKSHFKFVGIFTIVFISIYILLAIIMVFSGLLNHFPAYYQA